MYGRYNRACYVNRIFLGVGIPAFFIGQRVMGLTMGSFLSTKLLATIGG
jgi:hypothetical protein